MAQEPWISSSTGLRGPCHLVEQAEWDLASSAAATDEGLPLMGERFDPLITTLLVAGLLRTLKAWIEERQQTDLKARIAWVIWEGAYHTARALVGRKSKGSDQPLYLCLCQGVTEAQVHHAVRGGITDAEALIEAFGLGKDRCCGRCVRSIERFVTMATGESMPIASTSR